MTAKTFVDIVFGNYLSISDKKQLTKQSL